MRRYLKKYATFTGRASRVGVLVVDPRLHPDRLRARHSSTRLLAGPQPQPPVAATSQAELNAYIGAVFGWVAKASVAGGIWFLANLVGLVALSTRRLHDTGRSGWWTLLYLVPIIGQIIVIVFWASASKPEGQRYDR